MRILSAADVERLLDMPSCIDAVAGAFTARGKGHNAPSAVLGLELPAGGLHAKAAYLALSRPYVAAKINANIPGNPAARKLPTIQGVLVLFDASNGVPLAVMDSAAITTLRTAAASAVAARHLARADASIVTFVGCGVQARAHLIAMRHVRPIRRVFAFDENREAAERFALFAGADGRLSATVTGTLDDATRVSDIIVTTTPSRQPILSVDDVCEGAFVAAVGADSPHKQEIDPLLLQRAAVVVDDRDQCAHMGDLHHAIAAGVMQPSDVRASLDEVVAGARPGRLNDDEIVVFDSTGVAIEDVAAAALTFERAEANEVGALDPLP